MALKIRLRQQGKKNAQMYRLVLTESRNPRDGKYIEALGWYNPFAKEETNLNVQADRIEHWLTQGAVVTERVWTLLKRGCPQVVEAFRQRKLARKAKDCASRRSSKKESRA